MTARALQPDDVVFFLATSQDGFVADRSGSHAWASPYFIPELGFHDFFAGIANIIIGGSAWSALSATGKWPYGNKPGIVAGLKSAELPGAVLQAQDGSPSEIIAAAKALARGPTWLVGDTSLAHSMIAAEAVTRIDHYIMPTTLLVGTDHFDPAPLLGFTMIDKQLYPNQVERQSYARRAS